jgi:hypothetical protein
MNLNSYFKEKKENSLGGDVMTWHLCVHSLVFMTSHFVYKASITLNVMRCDWIELGTPQSRLCFSYSNFCDISKLAIIHKNI